MIKKLLLLLLCAPVAAQTVSTLASGGIGVSCSAVAASTSANPGTAAGCTAFALLTSGGNLPSVYTWQVTTTGSPGSVTVNLMGSLDGATWIQLDTASSATTRTVGPVGYRFLGCVPATLSGGSSPTVTCQISLSGGLSATYIAFPASAASATLAGPYQLFTCSTTCTVTPPTPVAGYQFCIRNDDNVATVITLAALPGIQYEVTARTSYKSANTSIVSGGTATDQICIVGKDSTHYQVWSFTGTWT